MTAFQRFGKKWAAGGALDNPSDAEADAGFIYLGSEPPTVEEFNSMFSWNDEKDNYLFGQVSNVISHDGTAPVENDLTQLLLAINKLINAAMGSGTAAFVRKAGDTMSGFLTLHSTPVNPMHAATKQYIDDSISKIPVGDYVHKGGDLMYGFLTLHTNPQQSMHAATKQYVDQTVGAINMPFVLKSGDTMTGNLQVNASLYAPYIRAYSASSQWGASEISFGANDQYRWTLFTESNGNAHISKIDNSQYIGKMIFATNLVTTEGEHLVTGRMNAHGGVGYNPNQDFSTYEGGDFRTFQWANEWQDHWQISTGVRLWGSPGGRALMTLSPEPLLWVNGRIAAVADISTDTNLYGNGVIAGPNGFYSIQGGVNVQTDVTSQFGWVRAPNGALSGNAATVSGTYWGGELRVGGVVSGSPVESPTNIHAFGDILSSNQGYKPGGGSWAAMADVRVQKDITPYQRGLTELLELETVEYSYIAKTGYDVAKRYVGLSSNAKEVVPEMVFINNEIHNTPTDEVTYPEGFPEEDKIDPIQKQVLGIPDLLCMDTSPLQFMLVNAVKELAARLTTLEQA